MSTNVPLLRTPLRILCPLKVLSINFNHASLTLLTTINAASTPSFYLVPRLSSKPSQLLSNNLDNGINIYIRALSLPTRLLPCAWRRYGCIIDIWLLRRRRRRRRRKVSNRIMQSKANIISIHFRLLELLSMKTSRRRSRMKEEVEMWHEITANIGRMITRIC